MSLNTYRVYVLDTSVAEKPVAKIAYVQTEKYGPAWGAARALLKDGKSHKDAPSAKMLFADAGCTVDAKLGFGDHVVVAKIVDIKPRNVKLDKTKLTDILNDPKVSDADKLIALTAQLAGAK